MTGRRAMQTMRSRRRLPAAFRSIAFASAVIAGIALLAPEVASAQLGTVVFTSFRGGAAHVYAVDADGSGLRALTDTRDAAFEGSPAFSPDGRQIAYTCGNFELCVMNADGSGRARLTATDWPREFRYDTSPAWSPDGRQLVFVRTVGGRDEIWIVSADGGAARQLPVPAGVNGNPSISPDGRTIVFEHADVGSEGDSDSGIYVIGATTALRRLTREGTDASTPTWSPDGRSIAFTRSTETTARVRVMNADGSGQRRVSPRSMHATDPAWSPDGATIAFAGLRKGGALLYKVPSGGGAATALTTGRGLDFDPHWQPGSATPPRQLPASLGPPSVATPDARVVGVLLRAAGEFGALLSYTPREFRAQSFSTLARRVDGFARRIDRAARPLRPATNRGRRVRRRVLQATTEVKGIARRIRRWATSDGRGARRHRKSEVPGLLFGVAVTLSAGVDVAGTSQTAL